MQTVSQERNPTVKRTCNINGGLKNQTESSKYLVKYDLPGAFKIRNNWWIYVNRKRTKCLVNRCTVYSALGDNVVFFTVFFIILSTACKSICLHETTVIRMDSGKRWYMRFIMKISF
jgi:hypothetical protein